MIFYLGGITPFSRRTGVLGYHKARYQFPNTNLTTSIQLSVNFFLLAKTFSIERHEFCLLRWRAERVKKLKSATFEEFPTYVFLQFPLNPWTGFF